MMSCHSLCNLKKEQHIHHRFNIIHDECTLTSRRVLLIGPCRRVTGQTVHEALAEACSRTRTVALMMSLLPLLLLLLSSSLLVNAT